MASSNLRPIAEREWSSGLCPTSDLCFCCGACWCPAIAYGCLAEETGLSSNFFVPWLAEWCLEAVCAVPFIVAGSTTASTAGVGALPGFMRRIMLRRTVIKGLGLPRESYAMSCCVECWCYSCSMAQIRAQGVAFEGGGSERSLLNELGIPTAGLRAYQRPAAVNAM